MSKYPKLTHYVSEIDRLLQSFDKKCQKLSSSQQKEQDKHLALFRLRDIVGRTEAPAKTWRNF